MVPLREQQLEWVGLISDKVWRNVKTGNLYVVESLTGRDCTNVRDGLPVVVYHPLGDSQSKLVREREEFHIKFTPFNSVTIE